MARSTPSTGRHLGTSRSPSFAASSSRTEEKSAELRPSLSISDGDIASEQERHKSSRAFHVSRIGRTEAHEILPFLGNRGGDQKTARAQRQHNATDREWILQIRAPHQRQQRRVQRVPDKAIAPTVTSVVVFSKGRLALRAAVGAGLPIARSSRNPSIASPIEALRGTMTPVGEPRAGRETTPGRSAGSGPTGVQTRKSDRSRESADPSATATTTE